MTPRIKKAVFIILGVFLAKISIADQFRAPVKTKNIKKSRTLVQYLRVR